jgi:hypothetical protein
MKEIIKYAGDDYKGDYSNECLLYAKIANDSKNIGHGAEKLLAEIKKIKEENRA